MGIKNIKEDKKSTEANTTLKDKLTNIKTKRLNLRGGGRAKRGVKKNAYGKNS